MFFFFISFWFIVLFYASRVVYENVHTCVCCVLCVWANGQMRWVHLLVLIMYMKICKYCKCIQTQMYIRTFNTCPVHDTFVNLVNVHFIATGFACPTSYSQQVLTLLIHVSKPRFLKGGPSKFFYLFQFSRQVCYVPILNVFLTKRSSIKKLWITIL